MLQNQRACQLVRSQTGCEPLALTVAWGARTAGRCAAGVLGAVKHQRFSDQQLETFAARAPGICPKPVHPLIRRFAPPVPRSVAGATTLPERGEFFPEGEGL